MSSPAQTMRAEIERAARALAAQCSEVEQLQAELRDAQRERRRRLEHLRALTTTTERNRA